jgi:hypothetical protein
VAFDEAKRMARNASLFAALFMIGNGCVEQPDVCRMSPPENSDYYDEYVKSQSDAKCQEPVTGDSGLQPKQ